MAFLSKKKKEDKEKAIEEKKQEQAKPMPTVEAAAIDPKVQEQAESISKDFQDNYNIFVAPDNFGDPRTKEALEINLLFGILGELMKMRKLMEEQ